MSSRSKRWIVRLAITMAAVLVLLGAGLGWLLGTHSGAQFTLARVSAASDGALQVGSVRGTLAGPLHLHDIQWHGGADGANARIATLQVDPDLLALLAGRLQLATLALHDVVVQLPPETADTTAPSNEPLSLRPPIAIVLRQATADNVHIERGGQDIVQINHFAVAGAWTDTGVRLQQLALHAPAGSVDLAGKLALDDPWPGQLHGTFHWTQDETTWTGTLEGTNNGRQATLAAHLTAPFKATIQAQLQPTGSLPWQLAVRVPRFQPKVVLADPPAEQLALHLDGHGDRHGGQLQGRITLDDTRVDLQALKLHYAPKRQQLTLETLALSSPDIQGQLHGSGHIDLAADAPQADLRLDWSDVRIPATLVGQELASAGAVTLRGGTAAWQLQGQLRAGPPGQLSKLTLDLAGTPQQISLQQVTLHQPLGQLAIHGTVGLEPHLSWELDAKGQHVNPGLLLPGWKGDIDLDLGTHGQLTATGPKLALKLRQLSGTLRARRLAGHGQLHLDQQRVLTGKLSLHSGHSTIHLDAHGRQRNDIDLRLAVVSLNDWLPEATGAIHGQIHIGGAWPALAVRTHLVGQTLTWADRHVGKLDLTAHVPNIQQPGGTLDLRADLVRAGTLDFSTITLRGHGDARQHALQLRAQGAPLSLKADLSGQLRKQAWSGLLSRFDVHYGDLPGWHLLDPAHLHWDRGAASIDRTCLVSGQADICLRAARTRQHALELHYRLHALPLALLTQLADGLPLDAHGRLHGTGDIRRDANGQLSGEAALASPSGSIAYHSRPQRPLLAWHAFRAKATLAPGQQQLNLAAQFDGGGHLQGQATLRGPEQALDGQIALRLNSLAAIELFTNAVANVSGHLDANLALAGSLAQPALSGHAKLADFGAELPGLGLKLEDGDVRLTRAAEGGMQLDGHITSGQGQLTLRGQLAAGQQGDLTLHVNGNDFLAANIPAAKVAVSPDLDITRNAEGLRLTGTLAIDEASVKLEDLPGAGATQASPDVVVVDDNKHDESATALPVRADITVDLGQHTRLAGYGLDGRVSGRLEVHQAPGRTATGQGQVIINGTYQAYGQDLHIKQGRLLFASTPIDNPGLDIRAIRELHPNATISDNEVVGLAISGTARRPVMTVFSNPPMEQSDALSYLITGKPLSAVKGGEGSMVNAAAQALGSATGDLLAKGIGARLGIDAGVSNSAALGTAAFTVGKYLSPRLYLSYGVGLFDPGQVITLRYILSQRWNFEAEQATDFSRASFNYRLEH